MKNAQASGDSYNSPVLQRELMSQLTIYESPSREDFASAIRNTIMDVHISPEVEQKIGLAKDALQMKDKNELFFTNTGDAQITVNTDYSQPVIQRSRSPDFSESSDEVIFFAGRGRGGGKPRLNRYLSRDGYSSLQRSHRSHRSNSQGAAIINEPINRDTPVLVSGQVSPVPLS